MDSGGCLPDFCPGKLKWTPLCPWGGCPCAFSPGSTVGPAEPGLLHMPLPFPLPLARGVVGVLGRNDGSCCCWSGAENVLDCDSPQNGLARGLGRLWRERFCSSSLESSLCRVSITLWSNLNACFPARRCLRCCCRSSQADLTQAAPIPTAS